MRSFSGARLRAGPRDLGRIRPTLTLLIEGLDAAQCREVLAFDRQDLFVLLDRLVDVVEVVAVGRCKLELGGQHDVEIFLTVC